MKGYSFLKNSQWIWISQMVPEDTFLKLSNINGHNICFIKKTCPTKAQNFWIKGMSQMCGYVLLGSRRNVSHKHKLRQYMETHIIVHVYFEKCSWKNGPINIKDFCGIHPSYHPQWHSPFFVWKWSHPVEWTTFADFFSWITRSAGVSPPPPSTIILPRSDLELTGRTHLSLFGCISRSFSWGPRWSAQYFTFEHMISL